MSNPAINRDAFLESYSPEPSLPFSASEFASRLNRVREEMARAGIDLLYVTAPESIYYLSGYQALWYQAQSLEHWEPISGIAIRADQDDYIQFETDAEVTLCKYSTITRDLRIMNRHDASFSDFIVGNLKQDGWLKGKVGLEMRSYRPNRIVSEQFQAKLEAAGCAEVVDATAILTTVRRYKSPQEMVFTRTAARLSDIGMKAAMASIRAGVTELDVWGEVMCAVAKAGGENPSITLPVHSGPKTACPHSLPSRRIMMPGDIVNVDVCAVYNRYHSDNARSFSIGEPDPEVAATIAKSAHAFSVLSDVAEPGVAVSKVTSALKAYYQEVGLWGGQWWTGGYELGCAFPPDWVGPSSYDVELDPGDAVFEEGMVVNYESDFYLPRGAGMSLLIDTLVFDNGKAELLHEFPHDLVVIE